MTTAQIEARVKEMAEDISRDYAGREPVLVGVLTGAFVFLADLARRLGIPVEDGTTPGAAAIYLI